jgi:hypothetical protein
MRKRHTAEEIGVKLHQAEEMAREGKFQGEIARALGERRSNHCLPCRRTSLLGPAILWISQKRTNSPAWATSSWKIHDCAVW